MMDDLSQGSQQQQQQQQHRTPLKSPTDLSLREGKIRRKENVLNDEEGCVENIKDPPAIVRQGQRGNDVISVLPAIGNNPPVLTNNERKNIKLLQDAEPEMFVESLLQCIYNNDKKSKRDHGKIQIDHSNASETIDYFCKSICSVDTSSLRPDRDGIVNTIIPVSAFANGNQPTKQSSLENVWDKSASEKNKKKMKDKDGVLMYAVKDRLEMVNRQVTDETAAKMSENNDGFHFGLYEERKFAIASRMRVIDDEESISIASNTLLVACFVKSSGKYSVDSRGVEQSTEPLYYDNMKVTANDVVCRHMINTNIKVYTSKVIQSLIRGNGYKGGSVGFVLVKDLLHQNEIKRIFETCKQCLHAIPVYLSIYCSHRMNERFAEGNVKKDEEEEEDKETPLSEERKKINRSLDLSSKLMKAIKDELILHYTQFVMIHLVRVTWISWTFAVQNHDKFYEKKEVQKRRRHRLKAIDDYKEHYKLYDEGKIVEELKLFQCFMIMLITQQSPDINSSEWMFRRISHNFTTPKSYLEPLKRMSFCNLLEVYIEIIRLKSLYTQRASSLLRSMVIIEILYEGMVPRTYNKMSAFKQMAEKKSFITLSTLEQYIGVGADSHVIRIIRACCQACGAGNLTESNVIQITQRMGKDPGAYFNEIGAEIGQAFADREKGQAWEKWRSILVNVAHVDEQYDKAISNWLGDTWRHE